MGYAQALFGAQLSLSAVPMSSAPLRRSASTASRVQSEQVTSQEQDRRQEEALDEVREITASSAARAGLSRANTIAPLPKARPEPRHTVPERTRKLVEPRPGKGVVTQAQSVPQPAEPPEQPAHKPGKRDLGPGNRQSATSKTGTAPAEPESPALSNSVSAGSKSRRLADTGDWTTARTLSRNPRSKSIISDDDTSEGEENGSTAAKLQEIATNAPVSKLAVPDARNQKPAKRKKSPLPLIWPESAQPVPKRLSSRFGDAEQEKQAAPEREEQEEPRVELRIRPRQKRGLLMLSDIGGNKPKRPKARHESAGGPEIALNLPQPSSGVFSAKPSIRPAQNPVCSQDSENEGHLPVPSPWFPTEADTEAPMFEKGFNKSTLPGNVTAGRPKTTESIYNLPDSTDDDFVTRPPPRQGNKVAQETANDAPEIQSARDSGKPIRQSERSNPVREICEPENNEASEDEVPTRKLRKRKTLPLDESESEEEEEEEFPQVPVGPRLARLGRKSVKSREVIGFIPSSSPVPEPTFAVGLFSSHPVHLDDKHSRSAAKNSEAAPEIEVTVKIIDKVPSQLDLDTSLHSSLDIRQPFPAPLADADVPLEVDASSSDINEGALDGKEMTTAASSLLIEGGVSTFVAEKNLPSQAMEGQVSMNELRIDEAASSTGRSARNPSNHLDDADLAYAGTTANMQNSAARGKDSAPKTMGPVADTRATPAAVATPTLQSLSHKHDGPTNQQTTPINPSHDVVVLPVTTNVPKNPAAQISSAESSSRPRIANPATRGRKAALKSDAAGQVPQSIVPPPEPVLVRPSIRPPQAARPDATVNERPKRVMRFPGFTTARVGGGPWSREAGDLLETGRPP
ncbi:hypothetical protein QBC44DRAFT_318510 [Cladorrhinum sp. PSN332]|nr:hypothetical protein QBC44DRAFT_318510 [Cladorrhinum sp. PSN332]